jgi:predicted cupin superfamily sugar epimerase
MKSDELWHFYAGSTLSLHIIRRDGSLIEVRLGTDIDKSETFQTVVKSGSWYAASINNPNSYSLVGCTASPGFDYRDWKLGDVKMLTKMYPQHRSIIEKYTNTFSTT